MNTLSIILKNNLWIFKNYSRTFLSMIHKLHKRTNDKSMGKMLPGSTASPNKGCENAWERQGCLCCSLKGHGEWMSGQPIMVKEDVLKPRCSALMFSLHWPTNLSEMYPKKKKF
jgi:hypothetical protein